MTLHMPVTAQAPIHGSLHFWLIQAKLLEHSELIVHSGLQFGGEPMKFCKQLQTGEPFLS